MGPHKTQQHQQQHQQQDKNVPSPSNFVLPESLPCSELESPILVHKKYKANWHSIVENYEENMRGIEEFSNDEPKPIPRSPFQYTACDYVQTQVFSILLPVLEETLNKAKIWCALNRQECFFNGIDWIAQELWNNNPLHPSRKMNNYHIFMMPWVQEYLKLNPRPYYPKSWMWSEEYAATVIQKNLRRYFVQREEDVQEMRIFWKKLYFEKENPEEFKSNYFLSKKFASVSNLFSRSGPGVIFFLN